MRKPDMRIVRTTVVSVVALGMLAVPANVALADDFRQEKADYDTAVSRSVTLTSVLRDDIETSRTLTVASADDDAATTIARKSLQGQIAKASKVSAVKHEDATVFNVGALTDRASSSASEAKGYSASISDGVKKVNEAISAHRLRDVRKTLETAISDGRKAYGSSKDGVDDQTNRDGLADKLEKAEALSASTDTKAIEDMADALNDLASKVKDDMNARQARLDREAAEEASRQAYAAVSYAPASSYAGTIGTSNGYSASGSSTGGYSHSTGSGSSGYSTSASCALDSAADHCQGAVDGGGLVDMNYSGGHIYAQHSNTGGSWINNLQAGQTFTMDGSTYQVNGQSVEGAVNAPDSGDWMQTCNGNGNHLVGVTKIG